ncbi:MAG: hypothetical protein Q4A27_00925 [bacterium]|nr:hypothetical protein [bacterium]
MGSTIGKCRICGKEAKLTKEHIIPRSSIHKMNKVYYSDQLLKSLDNQPLRYNSFQNGYNKTTLCKKCNSKVGYLYDKSLIDFFDTLNRAMYKSIPKEPTLKESASERGIFMMKIQSFKPNNIARGLLAKFCSIVDFDMAEVIPDIAKILLGVRGYIENNYIFPTTISIGVEDGGDIRCFSGIELGHLGVYFVKNGNKGPEGTVDITDWFTYKYDQECSAEYNFPIIDSQMVKFPLK